MCSTDFIVKEKKEYNYFTTREAVDYCRRQKKNLLPVLKMFFGHDNR